jgi:prepilin-type processing-associated H-X9-DG protein
MRRLPAFCIALTLFALLTTGPARAADDSVLRLVPPDAAAFVHVRVADVWNQETSRAVRDYLTKTEPGLLREFEREVGFLPAGVESVTLIFPEVGGRDFVAAPLIVVRNLEPFNKPKLLAALKAMTPGRREDWRAAEVAPVTAPVPNVAPLPPPAAGPGVPGPPPPNVPNLPVPPKFSDEDVPQFAAPDEEPVPEDQPGRGPGKPDPRAAHYVTRGGAHLFFADERTAVFAIDDRRNAETALAFCAQMLRRSRSGPLDAALAEAGKKHALVAAVNISKIAKALPEKRPAGLERFRALLGAKSAFLALDLGEEMKASLTVDAGDAANAAGIEDGVKALLAEAKDALPGLKKEAKRLPTADLAMLLLDVGEKALAKAEVARRGATVTATTSVETGRAWEAGLRTAVAQVRVARERTINANNLKQLAVGIHNYEATYGRLPFPGIGKNGAPLGPGNMNPGLSWRVALLPYIEQQNLYNQFKLDEPWDSEHNKALVPLMPKLFAPVNGVKAEKGHTFYQIFTGREALRSGMTFAHFTDGTANTLMIVEAGDSVPWTRPEDMLYDSKKPLPKLGGIFKGDFNAAFADGSVRFIRKDVPEKVLRALITPAGGETLPADWDR